MNSQYPSVARDLKDITLIILTTQVYLWILCFMCKSCIVGYCHDLRNHLIHFRCYAIKWIVLLKINYDISQLRFHNLDFRSLDLSRDLLVLLLLLRMSHS